MSENIEVPGREPHDERDEIELGVREFLGVLDPGGADPAYWLRFQQAIMRQAAPELHRRRMMTEVTIPELVSSWARTVVPTALLAAAAAGFFLLEVPTTPTAPAVAAEAVLQVEDVLSEGVDGERIPAVLTDEALPSAAGVMFASEIF